MHVPSSHRLLGLVLVFTITSCSDSEGPTGPPGGQAEWSLEVVGATSGLEPGEEATIDFDLEGATPFDAVLWVNPEEEGEYPVPLVHPVRSTTVWDSRSRLNIHLPILSPGTHTLALGDSTGVRSNSVQVNIAAVTPSRDQEEVAATLEMAFTALGDGVAEVFRTTDGNGRVILSDALGEDALSALLEMMDVGRIAGQAMAEEYNRLSPDEEAQYQAFLINIGLMDIVDQLAATSVAPAAPRAALVSSCVPDGGSPHIPHFAFFCLDVLESMMASVGPLMDLATIVSLLGGPSAAIPASASAAIALIRSTINTVVPTEITKVSAHHPRAVEVALDDINGDGVRDGEKFVEVFWATMRPKNKVGDGILEGAIDLIVPFANSGPPESFKQFLKDFAESVRLNIWKSIPDAADQIDPGTQGYAVTVNVVTNPRLFTLTVGDLATTFVATQPHLLPFTAPLLGAMKTLVNWGVIEDPEAVGSMVLELPEPIADAELRKTWEQDLYEVGNVEPSALAPWGAQIQSFVWHLGSVDLGSLVASWLGIYSIPIPKLTGPATHGLILHEEARRRGGGIIYTTLDATPQSLAPRDWLDQEDLDSYAIRAPMEIRSELDTACPGHATGLSIEVNGSAWLSEVIGPGFLRADAGAALRPGRNELVVMAGGSRICFNPPLPPRGVDVTMVFENSLFSQYSLQSRPNELTVSDTLLLWMPPDFGG